MNTGAAKIRPDWSHACAKRPEIASIGPDVYSSIKSPPLAGEPVRFELAATSTPVSAAIESTKLRPSDVPATEHP